MPKKSIWTHFEPGKTYPIKLGETTHHTTLAALNASVRTWAAAQPDPMCVHVRKTSGRTWVPETAAEYRTQGIDAFLVINHRDACLEPACVARVEKTQNIADATQTLAATLPEPPPLPPNPFGNS